MPLSISRRSAYSRAETVSDAAVHITGMALIALAVPALIILTTQIRSDAPALVAVSVYGAALAAMIFFSALYNLNQTGPMRWLLRRLDHAAIYLKIAGTFTPFTLLSGQGAALTVGLWGTALLGVGLKLISPSRWRWFTLALYLGMGWGGVVAGQAIFAELPWYVIALMAGGGGLYTIGVAFYLWEGLPFHYTIWHLFVLTASLLFYTAVVLLVLL
ncbi:hemolysin III [Salinihabitans flavidus]|uniref:Hemolysin III n=1 Tax=Salinihabitans flavidus TaxID=569882 RepID=A0A1H8TMD0_9RHOB|nr:hemolysin III family protein [Salinihabitans flavidus]SEO92007.1 hemolysin III [Salinihabitans flavidus]